MSHLNRAGHVLAVAVGACLALSSCVVPPAGSNPSASSVPSLSAPAVLSDGGVPAALPVPHRVYSGKSSPDRPVEHSNATPPGFVDPPAGVGLARYYNQPLTWQACGAYQCATFFAPLDWTNPDGQAITLAMRKAPATAAARLGVLMINPGGPGGSAQDFVAGFAAQGLEGYDIVGLDSRGSGASTPVVCGTSAQTDAYFNVDATPDNQAERDALVAAQQAFNEQCRQNSGALLDHISTIETAYDYDLARHLMGQQKLSFYGMSYGTFLGAVYAELFPGNVGRMVLDSAVNLTPADDVIQAQGFDLSLRSFAAWSAANGGRLGATEQEVVDRITRFIDGLDAAPLPAAGGRQLTQSLAVNGISLFFYSGSSAYRAFEDLLVYTMSSGDGERLLEAADRLDGRSSDGSYANLAYAFPAIRCADEADAGVQDAFNRWTGHDSQIAPIFGKRFGPDLACPLWTARPAAQIDFTGAGAPPLLVIQNTGDSATPFHQGEIMAAKLQSARLVVREAAGHGAYAAGSACMDTIVVDYFTHGTVPDPGTRCTDG